MKQSEIADHAVQMALDVYHAKEAELGEDVMRRAEKQIMLWAVDSRWVRHLTDLDRLRGHRPAGPGPSGPAGGL